MGVESYLVLWVFTDECCHPNRFRVELMLIESFEIGRLDFPNRDTQIRGFQIGFRCLVLLRQSGADSGFEGRYIRSVDTAVRVDVGTEVRSTDNLPEARFRLCHVRRVH